MKVIHLTSGGDVGGAKTHIISLGQRLSTEIDLEIITFRAGGFAKEAVAAGIRTSIYDGNLPVSVFKLRRKIISEGINIVHCHGSKANVIGMALRLLGCGARVVTTIHSDYQKDYLGLPLKRYTFGIINAVALRFLHEYIVVADSMAEVLIERGFNPNRILHIFNGIDFDRTPNRISHTEYFAQKGILCDREEVIIGIAARLTAVKDIKTLIAGFALAVKKAPNIRLMIAGDGEEGKMLKALSISLGVSDRVHFLGWISDMKDFYGAIDINTLTSLSEGFPYALMEGINAGCASISSDVKVARMLIDNGKNGYVFKIGDAAALGECLSSLANDEMLRKSFADRLLQKCSGLYSLERMKDVQIGIYERLIRRVGMSGRQGVCICGAYGRGNAGDDAILDAILEEMRSIDKDMPLWVLSKNPKTTKLFNRVDAVHTFNVFGFIRILRRARLFISGGGNLIQDATSSRSLFFYLFTIVMGKIFTGKVMMYGCGIGPVSKKRNIKLTAKVINRYADSITLREEGSLEVLRQMGVCKPNVALAADPALNLSPQAEDIVEAALSYENIPFEGEYIGISVRNWPGFDKAAPVIAEAVDYACETYGLTPVFLPIELSKTRSVDNDATAIEKVISFMKTKRKYIIRNRYDSKTTIGIISRMKIILSMRLHALVFAAGHGVPTIAVSYDPKVTGFMKYMGQYMCMDIKDVQPDKLMEYMDEAIQKSGRDEESAKQVDRLRKMEYTNVKTAKELLGYEA